jgi:ABC-type histidine transport system ATPase subunit
MEPEVIIEARNIHKSYGQLKVLNGVDILAASREVVTIIGASGSGKSTFLRCLNLLETPDSGALFINGEEILFRIGQKNAQDSKQITNVRKQVSMVFQNFNLWSQLTVLENVSLAPIKVLGLTKDRARDRARSYLDKVGILEKSQAYPSQLSGGQQQRCAIARALAMEPKLLLFDEPTSALDPELVGEVLRIIKLLVEEERSMILVTHEIGFAREISNKVVFIHQGLVEEIGTANQVFNHAQSPRCRQFLRSVL